MGLRAVAVVALTAALTGCSSDPELPSTLPSLSAAPSSGPTVSPVPSAISAPTPEGAGAFARFWYSEIEAAFATKDPERVRALSARDCTVCMRYIDSLTKLRDNGERVEGYAIEVVAAESPGGSGSSARVTVVYNTSGATRYDGAGRVLFKEPAYKLVEEELVLERADDSWRVKEVAAG